MATVSSGRHQRLVTEVPADNDAELFRRFAHGASLRELTQSKMPAAHKKAIDKIRVKFRELLDGSTGSLD